ncbi:phage baseplate protein [Fusobacterium sp. THCT1E1]
MPFINDPQGRQEVEKVSRRLKLPVWKSICKGNFRQWWNEWWDKIDTFAEAIEAIKIEAGTGLDGGGNLTKNRILSLKEATKTDLGGIKIGENLTYNPTTGAVDGNPTYTHPTTEGNKHIPAGGAAGNLLLWKSPGTGEWGKVKYEDITGTPVSLKNPYSLTINVNGVSQGGYDGSVAKTIEISSVPADHVHDDRYYTEAEIEEKFKNFCPYSIGDIYITTLSINPATRFLGTTWQKIEGRFLLSTSGSNASGQTGGSNTKTISKANLPAVKVQVDSFTLTTQPHTHPYVTPIVQWVGSGGWDGQGWSQHITSTTGTGGGQNTGTAAPYTSALGSGTPLDITPAYYTVHIWKRLS